MKKNLFLVMIVWWMLFFCNQTHAWNTNIWLVILWSGEVLSGDTSSYFPQPSTGHTSTWGVTTWSANTWSAVQTWTLWTFGWGASVGVWSVTTPIKNTGGPKYPIIPIWPLVPIPPIDESASTDPTNVSVWWDTTPAWWWVSAPIVYWQEITSAYEYAKSVWITNTNSIETARIYDPITRWELAKMIVEYTKNVKKKPIQEIQECLPENYKDVKNTMRQATYISDICSMYVMWWKNDGKQTIENFRPNDILTRAELGTVLSRYMYWATNMWDISSNYYMKHLEALHEAKIMNKIDNPDMKELRWNIMIMLQRISK